MRAFADLYAALDETTKTNAKITAMSRYFGSAPPEDVAWAVHFLIGRRPKRLIPTRDLVAWAIEEAGISPEAVEYINYHGTSTELNDRIETRATKLAFNGHAYKLAGSSP